MALPTIGVLDKDGNPQTVNIPNSGRQAAASSQAAVLSTEDLAALTALATLIGEVQASPTANTLLDRLKTLALDGTAVSGSVTSAATLFTQDMLNYSSISVQVTSAGSSCTITYETSDDNTNWLSTAGLLSTSVGSLAAATTSTAAGLMVFTKRGRYFRARVSTYGSGTVTVAGTLHKESAVNILAALTITGAAVTAVTPGTGATALGKAIDTAVGATDTGVAALVVRDDALATLTPADNDFTVLRVDSTGALWCRIIDSQLDGSEYETVAASQTAQALGATGATGDYISKILVVPATTSPGNILLLDNATSITVFTGGASSVSNLVPFTIDLGIFSVSGAWKITTGANVSVIGIGNFA